MEMRHAFFCDAATSDPTGKLNVLGIFDNINAVSFPATHPQLTLVLALRGHRSESGDHVLKIILVDQDGKDIIQPIEGSFTLHPDCLDANLIINIQQLRLAVPGTYAADVTIDNHFLKSVILTARIAASPT